MTATPHSSSLSRHDPAREDRSPEIGVWVPQLIETLERQADLLEDLRDLASGQGAAFAEGEAEAILDIVTRRSTLLDRVTAAEETVSSLLVRWRRLIELDEPGMEAEQVRVATLIGRVESLRDEILAFDREGQRVLDERRKEVANALAGMRTGRRAVTAYGPQGARGPRYQDREL